MVYNMILSYEDGVWIILSLDYNLIIEGTNKSKLIKKAEKRRGSSPRIRMSNIKRFD